MAKVLIIDDDEHVIRVLTGIIEQYCPDIEISATHDGLQGLQMVQFVKPDLIILDINLPYISGHSICRSLKTTAEYRNIPILIVTGEHAEISAKVTSLEYGAEAFLKKPFDIPELVAQLKSLLRLKEAEDKLLLERDMLKIDVRVKEKELEKNYKDIRKLFNAFIEVMATSIDALSIYNYDSTRKVAVMVKQFLEYITKNHRKQFPDLSTDPERRENLIIAAWLHDIGKISIPVSLMNKSTRLGANYQNISQRLEVIHYQIRTKLLEEQVAKNTDSESNKSGSNPREISSTKDRHENRISLDSKVEEEVTEPVDNRVEESSVLLELCCSLRETVDRLNNPKNRITESDIKLLERCSGLSYSDLKGESRKWLSEEEIECLKIERGTLTRSERNQIENHVRMTDLLLSKIPFSQKKRTIREWCSQHHEYLDGSGYHQNLKGDQIAIEARILTIVDVFEALISEERPYRDSFSIPEALCYLEDMAEKNKVDGDLVKIFKESRAWETV